MAESSYARAMQLAAPVSSSADTKFSITDGIKLRLDGVQKKWGRPTYTSTSAASLSPANIDKSGNGTHLGTLGRPITHIASNINLYMASSESSEPVDVNEQAKVSSEERVKRSSEKQTERNVDAETKSKGDNGASVSVVTHSEVNERPIKSHETRRRRDWNPSDHKALREAKKTPDQPEQINHPGFEAMIEKNQGTHGRG
jgi:hypothetical protein